MTEFKTMMDFALEYVTEGFKVFPIMSSGKTPLTANGLKDATEIQLGVKEYWGRWPDANIGLLTQGLVVIDFDVKNGGLQSKAQLIAKYGELPNTRVHKTGGGGEHWLYRAPEGSDIRCGAGKYGYPGLDIRANGGYIVAPPSLHESGKRYEVISKADIAPAPDWLLELVGTKKCIDSSLRNNSEMYDDSGGAKRRDFDPLSGRHAAHRHVRRCYRSRFTKVNELQCNPPKPDAPTRISHSVARYQPSVPITSTTFNLTDTGNAELLVSLFGDRLRYDHKRCRWLIWNGNIWQPDISGEIYRLAIESARERYRRATMIIELTERGSVSKWAIGSENRTRIEAAVSLSQKLEPVADSGENWDADKWLLGCENGVVDFKTGQLRPGKQSDCITMTTGIKFDPNAKCERWLQFLNEIFNGDESLDRLDLAFCRLLDDRGYFRANRCLGLRDRFEWQRKI